MGRHSTIPNKVGLTHPCLDVGPALKAEAIVGASSYCDAIVEGDKMKSWTTLGLVGGGVLLLIVTGYYFWPRGQLSETQRHVKSEFARPQQVSIHLARTRVELNGVNALQDTPVVLCDTDLPLDVWMPFAKPNERTRTRS